MAPAPVAAVSEGELPLPEDEEEEVLSPVARHEKMAALAAAQLGNGSTSPFDLRRRADQIANHFTGQLEPGIAMTIQWSAPSIWAAGAEIRIAPNDTVFNIQIPLVGKELSPSARALLVQANTVLSGSKADEEVKTSDNTPLRFLFTVAAASPAVRAEFVEVAGTALLEVFHKARLSNIWKDEKAAQASVDILRDCSPAVTKVMVEELLSSHLLLFDLTVDRWEARLAWELLRVLPPDEQKALLRDRPLGAIGSKERDKDHDLSGQVRDSVQQNLSVEYKASSRFTTFIGQEREVTHFGTAGSDTAKEALIARVTNEATWSGDEKSLRGALLLAIRGGATPFIVDVIAAHFDKHKALLMGLGFTRDGRYVEDIQDNTFTTWWSRAIAGVKAIFDVVGALWHVVVGPGGIEEIPLENIEKSFFNTYGVQLDHGNDVKKVTGLLETLLGNVGNANLIMSAFGIDPIQLLVMIESGVKAGDKLTAYVNSKIAVKRLTQGVKPNGAPPNTLVIANDQDTGQTFMQIAWLAIAGQAAIFDDLTVKMGVGYVNNAVAELKAATAHDNRKHIKVRVDDILLRDIQIVRPDLIVGIDSIVVSGLRVEEIGEESEPATLLAQIGTDVWRVAVQVMQLLPGFVGFGAALMDALVDGLSAWDAYKSAHRNTKQLGFAFDRVAVKGVRTSGGDEIESIEVGATSLDLVNQHVFDLEELDRDDLQKRLSKQRSELEELKDDRKKLGEKTNSKDAKHLDERIAWFTRAAENTRYQLEVLDRLEPMVRTIDKLKERRKKVEEKIRDQAKEEVEAKGGHGWERNQAADDAVADSVEIKEIDNDLKALERDIALLQGSKAAGKLGAITVSGVKTDKVELKSFKTSGGVISGELGLDAAGLKVTNIATATAEGLVIRDGKRRDLVLAERIISARRTKTDRERRAKYLHKRELSPAEVKEQTELDRKIAVWQAELKELKPLVDDYQALRGRLTDARHPLTRVERERLEQVSKLLAQPPSATVSSIELKGLGLELSTKDPSLDAKKLMSSAKLGLDFEQATVKGIKLYGEAGEGDTTIEEVDARGGRLGLDVLRAGRTISLGAKQLDVKGLKTDGTRVALERQLAEIKAEMDQLGGWLVALEPRRGKPDADIEIARFEQRREILARKRDEIAKKLDAPRRLDEFIAEVDTKRSRLVDQRGIDRSRGFSLEAGDDARLKLDSTRERLVKGETGKPGEIHLERATMLIDKYTTGIVQLKKQLAAVGKPKPKVSTLAEESAEVFATYDRGELQKTLDAAKLELEKWSAHKVDLEKAISSLDAQKADLGVIYKVYEEIVARGSTIPLDLKLASVESLNVLSAEQMQKLAGAQKAGMDGWSVGKLSVKGLDLQIENAAALIEKRLDKETYDQVVQIKSSSGKLVESVDIADVKRGETEILGSGHLGQISGEIQIVGPDRYRLQDFAVADFELGDITWDSATTSVEATKVRLEQIKINADIDMRGKELAGTIKSFSIGRLDAQTLKLRSGDRLFRLGRLTAGPAAPKKDAPQKDAPTPAKPEPTKAALAAIVVENLDLSSKAFKTVQLNNLKTQGLRADLGAGMTAHAGSLSAKQIKVGAVVSAGATTASRYSVDISGLNGKQLGVKLKESGLDVQIDQIRNASLTGVSLDLHTGNFTLDELGITELALGPISYAADGKKFDIFGGLNLEGVSISGYGNLLFNEKKEKALREKNPKRVPELIQQLRLTKIDCKKATLDNMRYVGKDASGVVDVSLPKAIATGLQIRDYDFATGAMKLNLGATTLDDFTATLKSSFSSKSSTTVSGNLKIGGLTFESLLDPAGNPVKKVGLTDVSSKKLNVEGSSIKVGPDGAVTNDDYNVETTFSGLGAGLEFKGNEWEAEGATTTFRDVSLDNIFLNKLHWASAGGDVTDIDATYASIIGLKASGHTVTRMQERGGLPLPSSDLYIDKLHIDKITAQKLSVEVTNADSDGKSRKTSATASKKIDQPAAVLTNLDIVGLQSIGGTVEKGRIDLESANVTAGVASKIVKGKFGPVIGAAADLTAGGMWVEFGDKGKTITAGMRELQLGNAHLSLKLDEVGSQVLIFADSIKATNIGLTHSDVGDGKDRLGSVTDVRVGSVELLKQAKFGYHRADTGDIPKLDNEKSIKERADEVKGLLNPSNVKTQEMKDDRAVLLGIDFNGLMRTINGTIRAQVKVDTLKNVNASALLTVKNGVIKPQVYVIGAGINTQLTVFLISNVLSFDLVDHTKTIIDAVAPDPKALAGEKAGTLHQDVSNSPFSYDKEAKARYEERVKKIRENEAFIELHKDDPAWAHAVEQRRRQNEVLRSPKLGDDDYLEVFLADIDADLSLGPWTTKIPSPPSQAAKNPSQTQLNVGASKLQFRPGPDRTHQLDVNVDTVSFTTYQSDGQNVKFLGIGAKELKVQALLASLFPSGSYRVYGWEKGAVSGKIVNPIEGEIKAGTKLTDLTIQSANIFQRGAKPPGKK